jgi:uncharacterized delta-60 repeat protein
MPRGIKQGSALELLEQRRLLSAGEIDTTFGNNGFATLDVGGEAETIAQLLPAPNGKFLAFGKADAGNALIVARFNGDGTLDTSFASGGKAETPVIAPSMGDPGAIAVDSAGRFAVVYSDSANGQPAGVAMFTANGALDHSFSSDGLIQSDATFTDFEKVGFQSDGRLIVAGRGFDVNGVNPNQPYNPQDYIDPVLIRRYGTNGAQDMTFGNGTGAGRGTTALVDSDAAEDMEVMSDGRIVLATHFAHTPQDGQIGQELFRLTTNGALDTTFAGDGSVAFGQAGDVAMSQTLDMDLLSDGSILTLSTEGTLNLVMHKFTSGGTPVAGFHTDFDRLGRFPTQLSVASSTGDIFLFGNGAAARYSSTGLADYTYGVDGIATVPNGLALRANANGTVLVAGSTTSSPADWQITRLQGGAGAPRKATLNRKGTLVFTTTNNDDTIGINLRYRDNRLIVRLGTQTQSFTPSKVKRIAFFALAGNDTITIGPGVRGTYVDGGEGNDTINGGALGDVLVGAAGDDRLYGNDGADTLVGGAGNDSWVGGAQNDDLWGEDGVDTLSGAGGNDRLFGGDGIDQLSGGNGADSAPNDSRDKRDTIETLLT